MLVRYCFAYAHTFVESQHAQVYDTLLFRHFVEAEDVAYETFGTSQAVLQLPGLHESDLPDNSQAIF